MKQLLSVLFAGLFFFCSAQDNVMLRGYVFDKETREPLSLAAVQIKNTQLGALTDDNGYFELPVPKVNLRDSLRSSFMGYLTQSVFISDYKTADTLRILLETQVTTKQEAVIVAANAKGVLLKAIDNLKRNMYKDSIIQTGFYRQYHKENGKYVRLLEADVSVAFNTKSPYRYLFHEMVQVNKQRRSENYETNGDVHGDHLVDLLKENRFSYSNSSFLNALMANYYTVKFEQEDSSGYIIKTEYKESSSATLEQARLWISKETYAITQIEIEKFPNPYYIKSKYAPDSRWKLLNEKVTIQLAAYKDKLVVSGLERTYNHHVLNPRTGQVDYIVEESFNLHFYKYDHVTVGAKMATGKFENFTSLYTSDYNYDDGFWNSYVPLKTYPLPEQVETDIEHARPLTKQFIESGK